MSLDRGHAKSRSLLRRAQATRAPRALILSGERRPKGYIATSTSLAGPEPSIPPVLGEVAIRALSSEQPRELSADEVDRLMAPLPTDDGGWAAELEEDRRRTTTDDPSAGR
ncbi:hypothetical protein AS188_02240 [Kocuria flava]|uniref:Prevent-host-death protein n=1 Tax=Kocuria flava TaxID=446860 RepID=A0A0U3G177_9MICC|nr:hypothetical protein [Kocuria flava]ALU38762.1 hypothetical protein AS188_02240 [Kocuria flava]GEO93226.1 hypothetical protein KFL01_25320 [Kocuria flava]